MGLRATAKGFQETGSSKRWACGRRGCAEQGRDEDARDEGYSGNPGPGISSDKEHVRLILRVPKQEPGEAVSVEGETGLLPGAQRILESPCTEV